MDWNRKWFLYIIHLNSKIENHKYNHVVPESFPGIVNLIIAEIDINGSKMMDGWPNRTKDFVFEADENNLNFSYTAICFQDIDQVLYKDKLVGNQQNWSLLTKNTEVRYTNLSPGKYKFVIRVSHRVVWIDKEASVEFTIKPFYWQTLWFKILVVVVVGGIPKNYHIKGQ